jgi:DNA ligase D-like protein (predicted ligase)
MVAPDLFAGLSEAERARLIADGTPRWTPPMLATLTDEPFSRKGWLFERKFDGIRCLAYCDGRKIELYSRNRQSLNGSYPELVDALSSQCGCAFAADGEIVAFRNRQTSFAELQRRMGIHDPRAARASGVKVFYYLFDLLHWGGQRLTALPLRTRKRLLKRALAFKDPLRYTPHRNTVGEAAFAAACRQGWEGVIAKRADSRYIAKRSTDWLKFKCVNEQEFVIGGYTDPKGRREGFGALLLGYYERGELRYAGLVGTGFDTRQLRNLHAKLAGRERDRSAFADPPRERGMHWVNPELVAEVAFTEWTDDGKLRHPRFLGLRDDKSPDSIVREQKSLVA